AGLQFQADLALDELAKLWKVAAQPNGSVRIGGDARLVGVNGYLVNGTINARNVSVHQNGGLFRGLSLVSAIRADQDPVSLQGLKLGALGGEFNANAELKQLTDFKLDGNLHNFAIRRLVQDLLGQRLDYGGSIGGAVHARANLKAKGTSGLA